jgi:deoxyguanosine kinase
VKIRYGPIVWIEGIIGAGKSTLTKVVADELHFRAIMEPVDGNPYLTKFYADPKRWATMMQMHLLHHRYAQQKLAAYEATGVGGYNGAVLDRGLPGDRVFARMHMLAGNIDPLEWHTYEMAYANMTCSLVPPSLLVFLDVDPKVALARIHGRGRECESAMTLAYLESLQRGYYDLMVEIESGEHAWSRGIRVSRVPWNVDNQPVESVIDLVRNLRG